MGRLLINILYTLFIFSLATVVQGQENYPIPKETPTRLFYIQHSNNHNTYVYDANIKNQLIDKEEPVNEYRIVYTEGGVIKPLTAIQKRKAYGFTSTYLSPTLFKLNLAANVKAPFYLTLDDHLKPKVYITINNRKMFLDRIFIQLKNSVSIIHPEADYILFEGKDYFSEKKVTEKYFLDH